MEKFEQAVVSQISAWAFDVTHVQALLASARKALQERQTPIADLRRELADVEARLQRYYDAFEDGSMSSRDVGERLTELNQQKKSIEANLVQRSGLQELPAYLSHPGHIEKAREALAQILAGGEHRTKRRYLRLLLESIAVQGNEVTLTARTDAILAMVEQGGQAR